MIIRKSEAELWPNRVYFTFTCIATVLRLNIIWEFPIMCAKYSGGVFFIIFLIALALYGASVILIEISLGQCMKGPIRMWRIMPILSGIGYAMLVTTFIESVGQSATVALNLFAFYRYTKLHQAVKTNVANFSVSTAVWWNGEELCNQGGHSSIPDVGCIPSMNNFHVDFLSINDFTDKTNPTVAQTDGSISPEIILSLFCIWCLIVFILSAGPASLGPVAGILIFAFYCLFLTIFIKTSEIQGAEEGSKLAFRANWTEFNSKNFQSIFISLFHSVNLGRGVFPSLAGYNKHQTIYVFDVGLLCLVYLFTVLWSSAMALSYAGAFAKISKTTIDHVLDLGGNKFASIVIPAVLSRENKQSSTAWTVIYLCMQFLLGFINLLPLIETINSGIANELARLNTRFNAHHCYIRPIIASAVALISLLLGLLFCTRNGALLSHLIIEHYIGWLFGVYVAFELLLFAYYVVYIVRNREEKQKNAARKKITQICLMYSVALPLLGGTIKLISTQLNKTTYDVTKYTANINGSMTIPSTHAIIGWTACVSPIITLLIGTICSIYFAWHPKRQYKSVASNDEDNGNNRTEVNRCARLFSPYSEEQKLLLGERRVSVLQEQRRSQDNLHVEINRDSEIRRLSCDSNGTEGRRLSNLSTETNGRRFSNLSNTSVI